MGRLKRLDGTPLGEHGFGGAQELPLKFLFEFADNLTQFFIRCLLYTSDAADE